LWLTGLFVLVWAADIGGYAVGRAYGRHSLARMISPGKTYEGALGGLVLATACVAVLLGVRIATGDRIAFEAWWLVPLVPLVAALSIAGDLFESLLKRQAGVKDSGDTLPGHGGIFDRIDGLLMAAPAYALILVSLP